MKKSLPIILKRVPIILTAIAATIFLANTFAPAPDKTFAFSQFGSLPVISNGRVQPIDSLARNSLLQIREKQEANLEPWKSNTANPKMISATEWLATVMMDPATADKWPVFRVDNPDVISLLKLPLRQIGHRYYSWAEIQPGLHDFDAETRRIAGDKKESSQQTAYEKGAMKVRERLWLYLQLKNTLQPEDAGNWARELAQFEQMIPAGVAAAQAQQSGAKYDDAVLKQFGDFVQRFSAMAQFEPPLLIPPTAAVASHDAWKRTGDVLIDAIRDGKVDPSVRAYAAMASAFQAGDVAEFNRQVAAYRSTLAPNFSRELGKARSEVFFNHMQPFYSAMVIYVLAGILVLCFWVNLSETLRRSAVWLIALALVIHTTGLIFRMVLEGRPPVTNLYSSAIFIGFGAVVLGLVLEQFHKNGIGAIVASGIGFCTLIIAHFLALTGDTMEMMRAVLDTNFWLATHVVIVTLGYASTFVAGFLGLVYVILGVFTNRLSTVIAPQQTVGVASKRPAQVADSFGKTLTRMIYGIVCFATLFSFVGTVLGGIWADQSWGRFWGWDPKENGALIIVLWNALILHLRWGGIIRERGLATCAIIGNIVTSWSWFGVNMLGIGLHSYGFMEAAFWWLITFVLSQLAFFALGCMPLPRWKSFRGQKVRLPSEPGETRAGVPTAA